MVFLLILAVIFSTATALETQQQNISRDIIRLHVLADSDSQKDQEIKLCVRDAVLEEAEVLLKGTEDVSRAKSVLQDNLAKLTAAANAVLADHGSSLEAAVTLKRQLFGTRHYEGFSLPGGYYDSLQVTIGSGQGRNWWCVVYPQICTASGLEDQRSIAVMGGLQEDEIALLQQEGMEYELKFRVLEIFENLMLWIRSGDNGIPTSR